MNRHPVVQTIVFVLALIVTWGHALGAFNITFIFPITPGQTGWIGSQACCIYAALASSVLPLINKMWPGTVPPDIIADNGNTPPADKMSAPKNNIAGLILVLATIGLTACGSSPNGASNNPFDLWNNTQTPWEAWRFRELVRRVESGQTRPGDADEWMRDSVESTQHMFR